MGLALDEPKEDEQIHTINEVELLIEENVLGYTEGNEIDFISNERGEGFAIGPVGGGSCC